MERKESDLEKRRQATERAYEIAEKGVLNRFINKFEEIFKDQAEIISEGFKRVMNESKTDISELEAQAQINSILEDITDWEQLTDDMLKTLIPLYLAAGEAGNGMFNTLYMQADDELIFSVIRDDFMEYIETEGFSQMVNMTDTTKKYVRDTAVDGLTEGLSVDEIAENISKKVGISKGRAKTAAATEVHSSIIEGNFLSAKSAGFREKGWLTADDEKVRGNNPKDIANHVVLNGLFIGIDDIFPNGLIKPGDPSGPPHEIINCRCILVFR